MQGNLYCSRCLRIGAVLICNLALLGLLTPSVLVLFAYAPSFGVRNDNLIEQLLLIALYAASFVLPVGLYFLLSRGEGETWGSQWSRVPGRAVWLIFASLAVITSAAYLNQYFVGLLELIGLPSASADTALYFFFPEDAVLVHISLVLVPAFCEELLFRGVILDRLLPYGKTAAILISAFTFGLMHGSFSQLFFATVAGIMLGLCYTETGSIWPGVIVHMLNNLWSYLAQYWYEWSSYNDELQYNLLILLPLLFVGSLGAIHLLAYGEKNVGETPTTFAAYGRRIPLADAIRTFCTSPTVIVYFVLAVGMLLITTLQNFGLQ